MTEAYQRKIVPTREHGLGQGRLSFVTGFPETAAGCPSSREKQTVNVDLSFDLC